MELRGPVLIKSSQENWPGTWFTGSQPEAKGPLQDSSLKRAGGSSLAVGQRPYHLGPFYKQPGSPHDMAADCPVPVIRGRERERTRRKSNAFYDLVSESHCHFCLILFVKSESLSLAHTQREGHKASALEGMSIKEFRDTFETHPEGKLRFVVFQSPGLYHSRLSPHPWVTVQVSG